MGVDGRWFNHTKREFVDLGNRWGYVGHPVSCAVHGMLLNQWCGDHVEAVSDTQDEFHDLPRAGYRDVTQVAWSELKRCGCYCVPGKTPDDPPEQP